MEKIFGTDGIRCLVNEEPLSAETTLKISKTVGFLLKSNQKKNSRVIICKDTRLSGYLYEPLITAGFISKLYLIKASISSDDIWIAILILISSALSVVYLWKIIEVMWMRDGRKIVIKENPTIYISLIIVTFLNIYFGLDASLVVNGSFEAADKLIGDLK